MSNETNLIYKENAKQIQMIFGDEDQQIWATAQNITDIFDVSYRTIREHIQNIYSERELEESSTMRKFRIVQIEGDRSVSREVEHFNLDVILSVGYRVSSKKATVFRRWANDVLKSYIEQGYAINEQALRESPEKLNELAKKIRELRFEEKQVYAKVRECFKISASDYDPKSEEIRKAFALIQNKLYYAVTLMVSSELINDRADHLSENMGLASLKGRIPTKDEVKTSKNYLGEEELYRLHLLSEQFLLFAEATALQSKRLTMQGLLDQLDRLLSLNDYPVFNRYFGEKNKKDAIEHALQELERYKLRIRIEDLGIEYDPYLLEIGEYDHLLYDEVGHE